MSNECNMTKSISNNQMNMKFSTMMNFVLFQVAIFENIFVKIEKNCPRIERMLEKE